MNTIIINLCRLTGHPITRSPRDALRSLPQAPLPVEHQQNALAEARLRIIARYKHVETWLEQPAPADVLSNWSGIVEGLREARRIIGSMWDELPVPQPPAVAKHQEDIRAAYNRTTQADVR